MLKYNDILDLRQTLGIRKGHAAVMIKIYKKLMVLLDGRQKHKMVLLVFLMLIGAVLETLGVSMIYPVMNVVLEENAIENHEYLQVICRIFHTDNSRDLTIIVMSGLILVFAAKNIFLFFQQKIQLKFVYTNQFATSRRMMINFMERPYEYYLNADTAVIQRNITSDVNNMYGLILSLLQLISESIVFGGCLDDHNGDGGSSCGTAGYHVYFKADHEEGRRRKSGLLQRAV